jgi:hypothetical protein
MNNGWVKLHRKITEWEWWHDMPTFRLFMYLLLSVTHKTLRYAGLELPPGSIVTGGHRLADETGLTHKQVRRALNNLEKTGEITRKRASKFSVITISNFDKYQIQETEAGQAEGKQRASRGQLNKKVRRKEEKIKTYNPTSDRPDWIEESLWLSLIESRKKVKAGGTELAYRRLINKLKEGLDAGYSTDEMIGEICMKGWKGFDVSWMKPKGARQNDYDETRSRWAEELLSDTGVDSTNDEEVVYQIQGPQTKSCGVDTISEGISGGLDCRASNGRGIYRS